MRATYKVSFLALEVNGDDGFAVLVADGEWPVFHITLDILVVECTANESFCVENCVFRIRVERVFGAVADAR